MKSPTPQSTENNFYLFSNTSQKATPFLIIAVMTFSILSAGFSSRANAGQSAGATHTKAQLPKDPISTDKWNEAVNKVDDYLRRMRALRLKEKSKQKEHAKDSNSTKKGAAGPKKAAAHKHGPTDSPATPSKPKARKVVKKGAGNRDDVAPPKYNNSFQVARIHKSKVHGTNGRKTKSSSGVSQDSVRSGLSVIDLPNFQSVTSDTQKWDYNNLQKPEGIWEDAKKDFPLLGRVEDSIRDLVKSNECISNRGTSCHKPDTVKSNECIPNRGTRCHKPNSDSDSDSDRQEIKDLINTPVSEFTSSANLNDNTNPRFDIKMDGASSIDEKAAAKK